MTKKQRLLELFESKKWIRDLTGRKWIKIFLPDEFYKSGFSGTIEYGQKHCDIIYFQKILKTLGHKSYAGSWAFYIIKNDSDESV